MENCGLFFQERRPYLGKGATFHIKICVGGKPTFYFILFTWSAVLTSPSEMSPLLMFSNPTYDFPAKSFGWTCFDIAVSSSVSCILWYFILRFQCIFE